MELSLNVICTCKKKTYIIPSLHLSFKLQELKKFIEILERKKKAYHLLFRVPTVTRAIRVEVFRGADVPRIQQIRDFSLAFLLCFDVSSLEAVSQFLLSNVFYIPRLQLLVGLLQHEIPMVRIVKLL